MVDDGGGAEAVRRARGSLQSLGFRLKEIERAGVVSTVLRVEAENGWALPTKSNLPILRAVLRSAAPGSSCSSDSQPRNAGTLVGGLLGRGLRFL